MLVERVVVVGVVWRGTSQTSASQVVDPPQDKYYVTEEHYQDEEQYRPEQSEHHEQPEDHDAHVVPSAPDAFSGGPSDLSLLASFSKHVACKIWSHEHVVKASFNKSIFLYIFFNG